MSVVASPGRVRPLVRARGLSVRLGGINVNRIKTTAFVLCAVTAGIAGLIYESNNGLMATDINGGQLVLYGVGAAVIGGTSLFGERGKPLPPLLGGIVIAAVTLDSLVRRRSTVR
jgi:D-xylose transport system permease protein